MSAFLPMVSSSPPPLEDEDEMIHDEDDSSSESYDLTGLSDKLHTLASYSSTSKIHWNENHNKDSLILSSMNDSFLLDKEKISISDDVINMFPVIYSKSHGSPSPDDSESESNSEIHHRPCESFEWKNDEIEEEKEKSNYNHESKMNDHVHTNNYCEKNNSLTLQSSLLSKNPKPYVDEINEDDDDDEFGDFDSANSFVTPSFSSIEQILDSLKPKIHSVIQSYFPSFQNSEKEFICSKDPFVDKMEFSPSIQFVWNASHCQRALLESLNIDSKNILSDNKWKGGSSLNSSNAFPSLNKVEYFHSENNNIIQNSQISKDSSNDFSSLVSNTNNKSSGSFSSSSSSNSSFLPKQSVKDSIIDSFPLLNFMQASTLQVPIPTSDMT